MSRKFKTLSLIFSIVIAVLSLFATVNANDSENGEEETPTSVSCPLEEKSGRYLINLSQDTMWASGSENDAKAGPFSTSIPEGEYAITLVSYDDHSNKPEQSQPAESWYLALNNGGSLLTTTNSISDLPEGQDWFTEKVNSALSLSQEVNSITAYHNAYPDSDPNSVVPVCAAFDEKVEPTPTPTPGNGGNGDNGNGGDKPDCPASSPTATPELEVFSTGPNSVMLTWNSVGPLTHYMIRYGTSPGSYEFGATNIGAGISYEVKDLLPGTNYYFQITGVNDCAAGHWSNEASTTTQKGERGAVLAAHEPVGAGLMGVNFIVLTLVMAVAGAIFFIISKLSKRFYILDK